MTARRRPPRRSCRRRAQPVHRPARRSAEADAMRCKPWSRSRVTRVLNSSDATAPGCCARKARHTSCTSASTSCPRRRHRSGPGSGGPKASSRSATSGLFVRLGPRIALADHHSRDVGGGGAACVNVRSDDRAPIAGMLRRVAGQTCVKKPPPPPPAQPQIAPPYRICV